MDIYFYNTLTHSKDKFKPLDEKEVKIYSSTPDTVGQFICILVRLPTLIIAAARIFIGKPAVVHKTLFHSEALRHRQSVYEFLLIKIEISRFPVI